MKIGTKVINETRQLTAVVAPKPEWARPGSYLWIQDIQRNGIPVPDWEPGERVPVTNSLASEWKAVE